MNPVVLQHADHLEAGAVADVREARIAMTAEVALENFAVLGAVERGTPRLELADSFGRFLGVQLGHPPVVHVLTAAHRIGKMNFPIIAIVDVAHRRRDSALGHYGVRLAEQRFANHGDLRAARGSFDRSAEAGAARADHQHIMLSFFVLSHCIQPSEQHSEIVENSHRAHPDVKIGE